VSGHLRSGVRLRTLAFAHPDFLTNGVTTRWCLGLFLSLCNWFHILTFLTVVLFGPLVVRLYAGFADVQFII
jgi:hypothetical protein